jgi:hypothetical protein
MAEEKQCCATEEYRGPLHVVRTCDSIAIERIRGLREEGIILDKKGYAELWECDAYGCWRDVYKLNRRNAKMLREMMERAGTLEDLRRIVRFVLDRGELVDFE